MTSYGSWFNVILGIWLIISPWVVGFSDITGATWNAVIVGIVVAIVGLWAALGSTATAAR